jgi:hypothetical protein
MLKDMDVEAGRVLEPTFCHKIKLDNFRSVERSVRGTENKNGPKAINRARSSVHERESRGSVPNS